MSLPVGEARQPQNLLEVRLINGSDFEIIVNRTSAFRRSFQYPARVEGAARIALEEAKIDFPYSHQVNQALLDLMKTCQVALRKSITDRDTVDYLSSLQASYEKVQARLIASVRHQTDMPDQQEG